MAPALDMCFPTWGKELSEPARMGQRWGLSGEGRQAPGSQVRTSV